MASALPRTTVTAKGQVTFRRHLLDAVSVKPGDQLEWTVRNGEIVGRPVPRKTGSIEAFFGSIKYDGPPISIDEINETIAKGWAGELKFED